MEEIFRQQIHKLKGPPNTQDKGFLAPLNIFLFQELQRLQRIIGIVRSNLKNLSMAIDGTVVMTVELLGDLNAIYDARVPKSWTHDASGQEISWLLPNLGGWFTGLVERQIMLNTWLENSRSSMKASGRAEAASHSEAGVSTFSICQRPGTGENPTPLASAGASGYAASTWWGYRNL